MEFISLPFVGKVRAGTPVNQKNTLFEFNSKNFDNILIPVSKSINYKNALCAEVVGDSMIEHNIFQKDVVVFKKNKKTSKNDLVVCEIDGDLIIKQFKETKDYLILNSSDVKIKRKKENVEILGNVIDVLQVNIDRKITKNNSKSELKINSIINGDAISEMQKIPSKSIDMIFADPPYNLSKSNFKIKFSKSGGKDLNTNKGSWDVFTPKNYENFTNNWITECYRILKDSGTIWIAGTYHNIYLVGNILDNIGFEVLNEILWHKTDATPNLSCTRFVADHENFIWARKKGFKNLFNYQVMKKMNGGKQMRSIWPKGKTSGGKKIHPTQKPEWLLERIILSSTKKNGIVLDPFVGSGTTPAVAKKLQRKYIGIELDKEFYKIAKERVKFIKCN